MYKLAVDSSNAKLCLLLKSAAQKARHLLEDECAGMGPPLRPASFSRAKR